MDSKFEWNGAESDPDSDYRDSSEDEDANDEYEGTDSSDEEVSLSVRGDLV